MELNSTEIKWIKSLKESDYAALQAVVGAAMAQAQAQAQTSLGSYKKPSNSTKRRSFNQLPKVDSEVLSIISEMPGLSRAQVANYLGMRLSTVCGAVNRLLKDVAIQVVGEVLDDETNRKVETLASINFENKGRK